jgi:uncharacterized iron-regulated membrane protein
MRKRSFGLVLLFFIIGITLVGCACGQQKMAAETQTTSTYSQPAVVQQAPPPAAVQQAPPPKQDRN